MRAFYMILLILFCGIMIVFALQNLKTITVSFFNWSVTLPVALVVVASYFLGMASGGSVLAFLRRSLTRAKK